MKDDAPLRALLAHWSYDSPSKLLAMGPAALDRLLDAVDGHGTLHTPDADWRDYEDALQAAIATFAARDMDDVLARIAERGWPATRTALSGVARVPDARLVPVLKSALATAEPTYREIVVNYLGMQRAPEATDALTAALSDRSEDVRRAALEALESAADPRAIPALKAFAKRTRSSSLAKRAREAIDAIAQGENRER